MSCSSITYNRVFNNIQSSLPGAINDNNVNLLKECINFKTTETIKCCIEASVRAYLMKKICIGQCANLNEIKTMVKICIEGTLQDLCLPTLPVFVLADAFDSITITQCEELFSFVEENVSVWKSDAFFASCKNQVLRMCNDVLRRLSRSQNTIFCGRILLFLARFFPFSERSGLNLVSEFNLENVTNFMDLESEVDDVEMKSADEETTKGSIDHTLYTKFWSLQDFFRSPMQCFQKNQWKIFTKYSEQIFDAFSSFKLESIQSKKAKVVKQQSIISANETKSQCFPKYLTSQELLDLQFSDSNFRRYVLLQMLIIGHYLTANVKFKQKSLTLDQISWIENITPRAYSLLSETPPNGQFFVEAVKHIFKREDLWNEWKNSGCPEEKKTKETGALTGKRAKTDEPAGAPPAVKKVKRRVGDVIKEADANNSIVMGTPEMTRLWNICPDNFLACKQKNRQFVPTLEEYFEVAHEMYQKKGIQVTTDELSNDSNFAWKALRLLILKSPQLFSNAMLFTLHDYISEMLKSSHKDAEAQKVAAKVEEDADKITTVTNNSDAIKDDEEEDGDDVQREGFQPIQPEEISRLAEALNRKGANAWTILGKKLGFETDEMDYFQTEGKSKLKAISIMLERWVENEKEEANQSSLIYTLEGLKMNDVAKLIFG